MNKELTQFNQLEASAQVSLARYEHLLHSVRDGIVLLDNDLNIVIANVAFLRRPNIELADMVSKPFAELWSGQGYSQFLDAVKESLREGKRSSTSGPLTINHELRWFMVRAYPSPEGVTLLITDITETRRRETALIEANQIIENSPVVLFRYAVGVTGWPIEYASSNVRRFGYEAGQLVAGPVLFCSLIHPVDRQRITDQAMAYIADGTETFQQEYRIVSPREATYWITHHTTITRNREDGQPHAKCTVIDISERKSVEIRLAKTVRSLDALIQCDAALLRGETEIELCTDICKIIASIGDYESAWVGYADDDPPKTVRPVAHYGMNEEYLANSKIGWDGSVPNEGPTGQAIRARQPVICKNIPHDPDSVPWSSRATLPEFRSSIALPLAHQSRCIGTLQIYSSQADAFEPEDEALLAGLANNMAYGINALRTSADKADYSARWLKSLSGAIESMSLTVEMRDPYTSGHMRHTAQLSVAIARELGLPDEQIKGLELGATIHDIGKIYVPAEILNRPGKLSDAEFTMIKTHSQVGYDIVKGIDFPWPIADIIIQHHERLDGGGYPNGLKGDEISYEAQILSVADVIEAMSSHRPYRPALGIDTGIEEIQRLRGTSFRAEIVDACIKIITQDDFSFE